MSVSVIINPNQSPENAMAKSVALQTQPAVLPSVVASSKVDFSIYLGDGGSGFDVASGSAGYTILVYIGKLNTVPSGGAFTVKGDGAIITGETAAISYAASASDVLSALTNPTNGLVYQATPRKLTAEDVEVTKLATAAFKIEFKGDDLGLKDVPDLQVDADGLAPLCVGFVQSIRAGAIAANEIQQIVFLQDIVASQDTWTANPAASHWAATINFNTNEMAAAIAGQNSLEVYFAVRITDDLGNSRVYIQKKMVVKPTLFNPGASGPTPRASFTPTKEADLRYLKIDPTITGLTGGTTNLDGQITAGVDGLAVGIGIAVKLNAGLQIWFLEAGADAEALGNNSPATATVVRPDDYAASTNEKIWRRYL